MPKPLPSPVADFTPLEELALSEFALTAMLESMRLGLFDTLEDPLSAEELAEIYGFKVDKTRVLLELLAAHGLLVQSGQGGRDFANSPLAREFLRQGSPFHMDKALELHRRFVRPIAEQFAELLRGEANLRGDSDSAWSLQDSMDGTEQFARSGPLRQVCEFVTGLPDFAGMRRMCDVGGNHGAYSIALLDQNSELRSELADLPEVAAAATARLANGSYAGRIQPFACDLRNAALEKDRYDLIFISHLLYGFVDQIGDILAMFRAALKPGGWFVSHHMNPDADVPQTVTLGREFITRMAGYSTHFIGQEFLEDALRAAGFDNIRSAPVGSSRASLVVAGQRV